MLVQSLTRKHGLGLSEEVVYNNTKDCVYIRCCDVQFSFHQVDLDCLNSDTRDEITDNEATWDGLRLYLKAKELYG